MDFSAFVVQGSELAGDLPGQRRFGWRGWFSV